jgi:hypothetical protein
VHILPATVLRRTPKDGWYRPPINRPRSCWERIWFMILLWSSISVYSARHAHGSVLCPRSPVISACHVCGAVLILDSRSQRSPCMRGCVRKRCACLIMQPKYAAAPLLQLSKILGVPRLSVFSFKSRHTSKDDCVPPSASYPRSLLRQQFGLRFFFSPSILGGSTHVPYCLRRSSKGSCVVRGRLPLLQLPTLRFAGS